MGRKVAFWSALALIAFVFAVTVDYPMNVLMLAFTGICIGLGIRDHRIGHGRIRAEQHVD